MLTFLRPNEAVNFMTKKKRDKKMQQDNTITTICFSAKEDEALTEARLETISFFDVKELYEQAYEALQINGECYKAKEVMAKAVKLDMLYRVQLARASRYQKHSKLHDFSITSTTEIAAAA